jgi:phosphopantetheinyl transferase
MASLPDFHHVVVAPPGIELVFGSLKSASVASKQAGEMRELGRDCARKAAHKLSGERLGELIYSELGAPLWSGGAVETHISISHTGQYAIGVAARHGVGVDIEFIDRDVSRLEKSFTPVEQELSQVVNPIALLCAKEAAGKSAGVGLAGSIIRWSVIAFSADTQSLLVRDIQTDDYWRAWISAVEVGDRLLQCAVAQGTEPVREDLLGIYESSQVEMRPIGSQVWQEGAASVRERALSGVVITAWNPGPERPGITENNQANELLLARLGNYCNDIWEADGFSPDRSHREPGFMAWGMSPEIGLQIAREFGQLAIFYFQASGNRIMYSV